MRAEESRKEERRRKAAGGRAGGGTQGRETKTRSTKQGGKKGSRGGRQQDVDSDEEGQLAGATPAKKLSCTVMIRQYQSSHLVYYSGKSFTRGCNLCLHVQERCKRFVCQQQ